MSWKKTGSTIAILSGCLSYLPQVAFGSTEDTLYAVVPISGSTQDFGIIDPTTGTFTRINQISPTGLGWPLGDIASQPDPINGYFFTRQTNPETALLDILAIKKIDGSTRWLSTSGSVVGYDTKRNRLILREFVLPTPGLGFNQLIAYSMEDGSEDVISESFATDNTMWQAGGIGVVDSFNRQAIQLGSNGILYRINLDDGIQTDVRLNAEIISISWDSKTQKLYGLYNKNSSGIFQVAEINYKTGDIVDIGSSDAISGISNYVQFIAPNDQRYYIQKSGSDVIAISLSDGAPVGVFPAPLRLFPPGAIVIGSDDIDEKVSYDITDPDSPIIKLGTNAVDFDGTSISSGDILIQEGALSINGRAESSNVVIAEDATLGGSGFVGGIISSGLISPGNSIGTLGVQGDVVMTASSRTSIEIDADGNADQIIASGVIRLGGSLTVVPQGGVYSAGARYLLFDAQDVVGAFDSETLDLSLNQDFSLNYSTRNSDGRFYVVLLESVILINDEDDVVTFSDNLSPSAGLVAYSGSGTLAVTGMNKHTAGFNISNGTLTFNDSDSLGDGPVTLSGATIKPQSDVALENEIIVSERGATYETVNVNVIHKGLISGVGKLVKTGNGRLELTNANSYADGTSVQAGTLALAGNTSAGTGTIALADGTTLQANNALTLANGVSLAGDSTVATQGNNVTLAGVVSGAGKLIKDGAGVLTLEGANSYAGGTSVQAGILALAGNTSAGTGTIALADGTALQANDALTLANEVSLTGDSTVATQENNVTLTGVISGAGKLIKDGGGVLTLEGANSYAGGTLVQSGVLALSATGAAGTGQIRLANDTVLRANRAITIENAVQLQAVGAIATGEHAVTVAGVVSGAGQLKKLDSGVLTLANANTYSGGTLLEKGTIVAANDQALGTGTLIAGEFDAVLGAGKSALTLANAVRLDHDLIVDTAGELMVLSGEVSGVGRLIKRGSGVLELASDNAYLGGTVIEQGTLALDVNAAASSGTVTMASDTVLQAQASLSVGNEIKLAGPVQMNTQGFDVTLSGVIGNNSVGQLIKTGLGTLTLTGQNQYSGGTIIQEGRLAVLGSLASGVQVQAQTELAGTGTIGGDVFNAGTIAPAMGSGPSRLTIVGNYVGEGGTFATVLGGTTNAIVADQLAIEGQGNRASGRTVISVTDPTGVLGRPTVGDGILLVDVSEGATSTTDAFSAPRIAAGAYEYTLNRGGEESAQSWFLRADIDAPPPPVIVTPQVAQREEVALYPALPSLARQYLWSINGTLDDRRGAPDVLGQWQEQPIAWGRFVGQGNKTAPGNADKGPGLKTNDWALQLGADLLRSSSDWGQWRAGPVLTLGRSVGGAYNARGTVKTGDVSLNAYSLGLNATVASKHGGYADLLLMATRLTGIEARSPLGTSISTTGWAYSGSLEGGWRVAMSDRVSVTPQAQIYSTTVDLNNTADAFSRIDMATNTSLLGRLGVKLAYDNQRAQGPATTFWARASVYSTLAGKNAQTSFLNVLGTNATTFDSQAPGTWFALDAALNVQTSRNTAVQFGVGYQTSFNSQFQGVYGQVNLRIGF